ncbi:lactosylceramide 4-alpha-galactosyltransferase-like isoform X2 [Argiope bruennichi]|uniref:lactosylceramide 4-alpha-galactosyltransferase-like isoform X2 n=1 Tax=Argiope bruennichi TaxID=94029 RepID=UPI00249500DA|nr:lactosylceramide 4-alpha-galactosyltransferase-like isoform X2 [Argiope bruennichi]
MKTPLIKPLLKDGRTRMAFRAKYWLVAVCTVVCLTVLLVYRFILTEDAIDMAFHYGTSNIKCGANTKLLETIDRIECIEENPIFFLETSNSPRISARGSCAVESAAKHHPDRQTVHVSDALRLSIIWKYGGIYLDTDVVVLRSLSHLHNTTTTDNGKNLGSAFLAFEPYHPLLQATITDFATSYTPSDFASNGPVLLNKHFKQRCHVELVDELYKGGENTCDVDVLPYKSTYPIDYKDWREYFKPQETLNETAFDSCFIIHVWNYLSHGGMLVVGQNSLYEVVMKRHCPKVYELIKKVGFA